MDSITDTEEGGSGARWAFAAIASVIIHVVVIGVFLAPGCDTTETSEGQSDAPEVAQTDVTPPTEGDSVGQESSYTPPGGSVLTPESGGRRAQRPSSRAQAPTQAAQPARQDASSTPAIYVVKQGDNLTKIARAHGTTAEAIAKANGKSLSAMNMLWVGQKIKLK